MTVVVLSFNHTADTLACLASLESDPDRGFSVLVVDNGSTDGAPAAIRAAFPAIELLVLAENRGWAGGNNAGVAHALAKGAAMICLLNNDTIVPPGTMAALAATARRFDPCLVHPAIDYADAADGIQLDPSLGQPEASLTLAELPGVFTLDFAYGACLAFTADLWRRVGPLDERFFLQMEETDFWLRAKMVGAVSLCTTRVRIVHAESRSFGGRMTPVKTYYIARNTLLLAEKQLWQRGLSAAGEGFRYWRSLYWFAAKLAAQAGAGGTTRAVIGWLVSADPHARAYRAGLSDYMWRRFGRISVHVLRAASR